MSARIRAHGDERPLELDVGREPAAALQREIELRKPHGRAGELFLGESFRVAIRLLARERVHLESERSVPRRNTLLGKPLELTHPVEVPVQCRCEPRSRVASRLVGSLEHRLAEIEQPPLVALGPCVRERERGDVGDRGDELFDLGHPDRLALSPRGDLRDLVREPVEILVSDVLHEERARVGLRLDARLTEPLGHPRDATSLGDLEEQEVTDPRTRLGDRGVLLQLEADQGEHGVRRRCSEVRDACFDVRRLPAADRRAILFLPAPVDVRDEHEPGVTEQASRVTERDDVRTGCLERRDDLDRLVEEPGAEASNGVLDLGSIAARDQICRLQRWPVAHAPTVLDDPYGRSATSRRTRARPDRPRPCDTPQAQPGRARQRACLAAGARSRCALRPRSPQPAGRGCVSASASRSSDEPWWATLSTSTRRSGSDRVTSDSESPVRRRSIDP